MNRKRILLLDDDLNLLHSLEFILEAADFEVTTGRDGHEGLEKILRAQSLNQTPDLLVTDVLMPGLNGLQLIDEIRRLNIRVPVLAITAYGDPKLKRELGYRGCHYYVDKPFNEEKLLQNVFAILEVNIRIA